MHTVIDKKMNPGRLVPSSVRAEAVVLTLILKTGSTEIFAKLCMQLLYM